MVSAIVDTSFLIDWIKYSKSRFIFKLFDVIYIPESVLAEIRSERSLLWIAESLEKGELAILPELPDISREALNIVARSRRLPIRPVDYPEAFCLVAGKRLGLVVLTENGGAIALRSYDPEYSSVEIWRGIDILYKLWKFGYINSFKDELELYQQETKHIYSRRDLAKYGDYLK
uniref:DNA-binding protein n=1 Tax=Ignisphaera aggregans TaxID=334771 RepID=A0A7C5UXG9_9CREN